MLSFPLVARVERRREREMLIIPRKDFLICRKKLLSSTPGFLRAQSEQALNGRMNEWMSELMNERMKEGRNE